MQVKTMTTSNLRMAGLLAAIAATSAVASAAPKNVILMIGDGMGFNAVEAAALYEGSRPVYESFPTKLAMQTYSATGNNPYSSAQMASSFNWQRLSPTDSAAAASAMFSGVKNRDATLNWSTSNVAMTTVFEEAARAGKSIGAVSSVPISHATPAGVYGHNSGRNNYAALATEGITGSNPLDGSVAASSSNPLAGNNGSYDANNYNNNLKVLMGAGNPGFGDNGQPLAGSYNYVGGSATWNSVSSNGWSKVESRTAFEALQSGPTPDKVLGIAQVATTLQQARTDVAFNANVPTLPVMARAALNVLDNNASGFAVMIEGGAIDWAGHANQTRRLIEETTDFNLAVQAVVDYLNSGADGNDWSNTLLIVTADHETGALWGPGTYTDANGNGRYDQATDTFNGYQLLQGNGTGNLPNVQWASGDHTNQLVPLYARGEGAELLLDGIVGVEGNLAAMYAAANGFNGSYIDNTYLHTVMSSVIPEPSALGVVAISGLLLRRRRGMDRSSAL